MSDPTFRDEIRETVSPYKFGGDRMAAACWILSLDQGWDEETGDASEWSLWAARFGRRLLEITDQGFVYCTRYPSEDAAHDAFAAIESDYCAHMDAEEIPAGYEQSDFVTIDKFYPGETVRVKGYRGVAWRIEGLPVWHGSDYEWSGIFYQDTSQRTLHMVGDDRTFTFDVDDLEPLGEGEYCQECGQIGCGWHV